MFLLAGLAGWLLLMVAAVSTWPLLADDAVAERLQEPGAVLLIRHALAPGVGDPDGFRLDDCATQRNLSDEGRRQARAIGDWLRARGIGQAHVYSSQWCRCLETAALLDLGPVTELPALNSFFERRQDRTLARHAFRTRLGRESRHGFRVLGWLGLNEGEAGKFEHRLQLVDRERRRLGGGQSDGRRHSDHLRSAKRCVASHGDRRPRHDDRRRRPGEHIVIQGLFLRIVASAGGAVGVLAAAAEEPATPSAPAASDTPAASGTPAASPAEPEAVATPADSAPAESVPAGEPTPLKKLFLHSAPAHSTASGRATE